MSTFSKTMKGSVSRRTMLKGAAGAVGLAAGSGAITGFPYVKSAEPKVLRYLGTAVNEGDDIAKKCLEDTGIKIEYITVDHRRRDQARRSRSQIRSTCSTPNTLR